MHSRYNPLRQHPFDTLLARLRHPEGHKVSIFLKSCPLQRRTDISICVQVIRYVHAIEFPQHEL